MLLGLLDKVRNSTLSIDKADIKPYLTITFGLFLFAIGWTGFLIPSEIVGGGLSGLASIIYFVLKIPVAVSYSILNCFILIISVRIMGAKFGIKTVIAVGILSFFFAVLQTLIKEPFVQDQVMATIIGGIFYGLGIGLVFHAGGSAGGTDIIAMIINKYYNISPGRVLLYCDVIIIGATYLIFHSVEKIIYGLFAMAIASYTIDMVLNGKKQSVQMIVISPEYLKIYDRINSEVYRCATVMNGVTSGPQNSGNIVMIFVPKNETRKIVHIITEIDPDAFITQGNVMGVHGHEII